MLTKSSCDQNCLNKVRQHLAAADLRYSHLSLTYFFLLNTNFQQASYHINYNMIVVMLEFIP